MGDGGGRERDAVGLRARPDPSAEPASRGLLTGVLAVLGCLVLWAYRRPEQLSRPYVWVEESVVLQNALQDGWVAALQPVNGSLSFPATPLLTASALADLPHFATTNAVLAAAVFALTIWILVVPDSAWGGPSTRAVMALGVTLCPTDPEVFGVLLYSFWWASQWPLIIFGWTQPHWRARVPLLAVAALSSPAAGALFVLFAAYGWMHRRRHDVVSAAILATGLLVEFILALTSGRASNTSHDPVDITTQLARTFGVFVWPWPRGEERHWVRLAFLGVVVLVLLAVLLVRAGPPVRLPAAALAAACLIYAGFSALPNPLMTDPRDAGPRYFFLPFTALIWLLIHLAAAVGHNARIRLAAALIALSALLGAFPVLHRAERYRTAHLNWADEIGRCAASTAQEVDVPIYFDGSKRFFLPPLLLTPEDCRAHS